jgi:hypothetical protein
MKARFVIAFLGLSLLVLFQNCAQQPTSVDGAAVASAGGTPSGEESVVGVTSDLDHITYDAALSGKVYSKDEVLNSGRRVVDVWLNDGSFSIKDLSSKAEWSCRLTVTQEQALKSLLSVSRVCQPAPNPQEIRCLALPVGEDVVLSNDQRKVGLARVICKNGTYLCDGNDEKLRALLEVLRQSDVNACDAVVN